MTTATATKATAKRKARKPRVTVHVHAKAPTNAEEQAAFNDLMEQLAESSDIDDDPDSDELA